MRPSVTFFAVLLLATVPMLGCLGGPTDDLDTSNVDPTDAAASLGNAAVVHRAGDAAPVDATAVLPEGVPAPSGLSRIIQPEEGALFEPTIGVTSDGTLFVSNWGGQFGTEWSSILRSTDDGRSWEDVTGKVGPASSPPQSNDPYVYVDQDTDRVYNLDMQGLSCNFIRWSDDGGDTWTANPLGCGATPLLDHPTLFAGEPTTLMPTGYENVVYLCVNRVADSACSVSLDGGLTWTPFTPVFPGADAERAESPADPWDGFCGGLHAHGTTGPDGTAYLPKGQCGVPSVAISQDNGMTWETVAISEDVMVDGHEVAFAVDDEGNAFAFWISQDLQPTLAASTDGGLTWSDAVNVAPEGLTLADKPTLAAGSNGSIALAYIGTDADADTYEDVPAEAGWNAYITTIVDATEADPVIMTTTANTPTDPIARGVCGGERCWGEEGGALGDFIDVTIDDEGRPWAAFVDVCTEECVTDPTAGNDVGVGFVGTLLEGPSLRGAVSALPPLAGVPAS